jgi:hypothetical protein
MPLKKYKLSKKSRKLNKSSKSKKTRKFKSSKNLKTFRKKNRVSSRSNLKFKRHLKGGFSSSCNLATVQEPAFNIDALGSLPGLSIPGSTGAIYRPNCSKNSSSQAMVPI